LIPWFIRIIVLRYRSAFHPSFPCPAVLNGIIDPLPWNCMRINESKKTGYSKEQSGIINATAFQMELDF